MAVTSTPLKSQVSNYQIYTLFIYNFTKYIQWPDNMPNEVFKIGIYGNSPIIENFNKLAKEKKVGIKNIEIIQLNHLSNIADMNILFIPDSNSNKVEEIVNESKSLPILIVTEKTGLVKVGAGISFINVNNNIKFQLNTDVLSAHKLKASRSLESLAYIE
ncbi:MAG: YfiR family protein [Fulvivirga sp.]